MYLLLFYSIIFVACYVSCLFCATFIAFVLVTQCACHLCIKELLTYFICSLSALVVNRCSVCHCRQANMSEPNFEVLKATLISRRQLWEDDEFPASWQSLASGERGSRHVKWLRPSVSNSGALQFYLTMQYSLRDRRPSHSI